MVSKSFCLVIHRARRGDHNLLLNLPSMHLMSIVLTYNSESMTVLWGKLGYIIDRERERLANNNEQYDNADKDGEDSALSIPTP